MLTFIETTFLFFDLNNTVTIGVVISFGLLAPNVNTFPPPYNDNMVFQLYILPLHVLVEDICRILLGLFLFVLAMLKRCGIHHSNTVVRSGNNLVSLFDLSVDSKVLIALNGFLNYLTLCS